MQDGKSKEIVDSQGNILKSTKDNKIKQFLKDNIWNIGETGLAIGITVVGMLNLVISRNFSISCANFYGIDRKYFSGTEIFEDKMIFILCALVLVVYPFIFSYVNKKINSKAYVIITFIMTILILFFQIIVYTVELIDSTSWGWLKHGIDNNVTIGIFGVTDILIAYFIIIRDFFWKKRKYNLIEKMALSIALLIYALSTAVGIVIKINYEISDKKVYEVIKPDKVIVSNYEGKFVLMNCEIQDEMLILKRGTYSLEEMTGISITSYKYEKVVCE